MQEGFYELKGGLCWELLNANTPPPPTLPRIQLTALCHDFKNTLYVVLFIRKYPVSQKY